MDRDAVIDMLERLSGPLGPRTTLDARMAEQDRWVRAGGVALLEALVDVVAHPPAARVVASDEDWEALLVEVTSELGRRHADQAIALLLPVLDDGAVRGVAIDILGGVGDARAVPRLEGLLGEDSLAMVDRVRIAGALGELGGDQARRVLRAMRAAAAPGEAALIEEIRIALVAAG